MRFDITCESSAEEISSLIFSEKQERYHKIDRLLQLLMSLQGIMNNQEKSKSPIMF